LGEFYQKGTIFYKEYVQGQVPAEEELQRDLSTMMDIYRDYFKESVSKFEGSGVGDKELLENCRLNT
jgi:hypothetical protein